VKPESASHVSSSSHLYAKVQKRPSESHPAVTAGKSSDGKDPASPSSNLSELDSLLAELSSSQFAAKHPVSCADELYDVYLCLIVLSMFSLSTTQACRIGQTHLQIV